MPTRLVRLIAIHTVLLSSLSVVTAEETSVRETPLVRAVRECRDAVVNIHTEKTADDERENRFFSRKERKVTGMGTGIVVDERGFIVTNYHVIQDVDQIIVTQENGAAYTATPVSQDTTSDLAIIRIHPPRPMNVMDIGTSSDIMLAEQVFAVGNAFGYEHTVTAGIVSAVSRDVEVDETQSYDNLIQTDASINPGNSGGPLLNLDGEVIGINVAIRAGAQRIGFAIPIDDARRIIAQLLSRISTTHGLVGLDVNTAADQHLLVKSVTPGSPAASCGLQEGDVIRTVQETKITDTADWERSLLDLPLGKEVQVTVDRKGESVAIPFSFEIKDPVTPQVAALPASTSIQAAVTTAKPASADGTRQVWHRFGIRVAELSNHERKTLPVRYSGGMKILFVQAGSLGARHGLRNGDILVGLDGYETLASQNLEFVLNEERIRNMTNMSFQIIRNGSQALVGSINLTASPSTAQMPQQSVRR